MSKTHSIKGDLELLGIAYLGSDETEGTTRTIMLRGSEANIGLDILLEGTGVIRVPVGYEDNISSDRDLINRGYANSRIGGIQVDALVMAPTGTEDGYALTYDHASTSYKLLPVADALDFENGLTESGGTVKLGGDVADAETNITLNAEGVLRFRSMFTTGSDEAGLEVEAVAEDNNQVRLYAVGGAIRITPTEAIVTAPGAGALKYSADYGVNFTTRSLPDVAWVNSHIGGLEVDALVQAPTATEDGYTIAWDESAGTYVLNPPNTGIENPFADNLALIKNNSDNTKLALFSAADIATGTMRTYTMPDASGNMLVGIGPKLVTVGSTEPTSPSLNDIWVDTITPTTLAGYGITDAYTITEALTAYNALYWKLTGTTTTVSSVVNGTPRFNEGFRIYENSANNRGVLFNCSTSGSTLSWEGSNSVTTTPVLTIGAGGAQGPQLQLLRLTGTASDSVNRVFQVNTHAAISSTGQGRFGSGAISLTTAQLSVDAGSNLITGSFTGSMVYSTGSTSYTFFALTPTYNTTGTYSGTAIGLDYNPTLTFTTGLTHYAARFVSGGVLIGATSITAGTVLDVRQHTGFASNVFRTATSGNSAIFTVDTGGQVRFGTTSSVYLAATATGSVSLGSTGLLAFVGTSGFWVNADGGLATVNPKVDFSTSGQTNVLGANVTSGFFRIRPIIANTDSGTTTFNYSLVNLAPTLNFNAGTSTVRGIYYNPTITSVANATHIAFENASGQIRLGGITEDVTKTRVLVMDASTNQVFWREDTSLGGGGTDFWAIEGTTTLSNHSIIDFDTSSLTFTASGEFIINLENDGFTSFGYLEVNGQGQGFRFGQNGNAIEYLDDYSVNFTARSLADWGNVWKANGQTTYLTGTSSVVNGGGTSSIDFTNTAGFYIDTTPYVGITADAFTLTVGVNEVYMAGSEGLKYTANYVSEFTDRSIPDWGNVWKGRGTTTLSADVNIIAGAHDIALGSGDSVLYSISGGFVKTTPASVQIGYIDSGSEIGSLFTINSTGTIFQDDIYTTGIQYAADYSANFTARSLVDKAYVDGLGSNYFTKSVSQDITGQTRIYLNSGGSASAFYLQSQEDGTSESMVSFLMGHTDGGGTSDYLYLTAWDSTGSNATLQFNGNGTVVFEDNRAVSKGIEYGADYSSGFTARSLVDKAYVDSVAAGWALSGTSTLTGATIIDADSNDLSFTGGTFSATSTTGDMNLTASGIYSINITSPLINVTGAAQYTMVDATTNTVYRPLSLIRNTTGAPAAGIGVGMAFSVETSSGNTEILSYIDVIPTTLTPTAEDADMVFKLMNDGAAATEKFRIGSTGLLKGIFTQDDALTRVLVSNSSGEVYWRDEATIGGGGLISGLTAGRVPVADTATTIIDYNTLTFDGANLTIGNIGAAADTLLHVWASSAGAIAANGNSVATFEKNGTNYVSLLTPNANESGIIFGRPSNNTFGYIISGGTGSTIADAMLFGVNASTRMYIQSNGNVGIGTSVTGENANGRLSIHASTINSNIFYLTSEATSTVDDPVERYIQNTNVTTNATQNNVATIDIPASSTIEIDAVVVARRTGGVAGTNEDGASYHIIGTFKNVAGTATQIGSTTAVHTAESQAGWSCFFSLSGGNVTVNVIGATDNNISWFSYVTVRRATS